MGHIIRFSILFLISCVACIAQSASQLPGLTGPPDLNTRIERQVRFHYKIPSDATLLVYSPTPSTEFPNYDEVLVAIETKDKKQNVTFLISKDRSSLVRLTNLDLANDPFAEVMSKIDLRGRPVRGAKSSQVVMVTYDDLECPFCTRLHRTLFPEILKEYGDRVTFVYEDFPLTQIHPWAMHAAVDANCLAAQNGEAYWDFVDYIHANQQQVNDEKSATAQTEQVDKLAMQQGQKHSLDTAKLQSCLRAQDESAVRISLREGTELGVEATPVVFVNGEQVYGGAVSADVLRSVLDRALKAAGATTPQESTATVPAAK